MVEIMELVCKVSNNIRELQDGLIQGDFTCRQVIEKYIAYISTINNKLNAIVVTQYEQALRKADEIDMKIRSGEKLGQLFGVPVTVKECFDLVGTPTTWGLKSKKKKRFS